MPKRMVEFFVVDILVQIDKIKRCSSGYKTMEALIADEFMFAATLRELEILGEAAKYIVDHPPYRDAIKPHWRGIVDLRNVIAHEYFGITHDEIFRILKCHIPVFEEEFIDFLLTIKDDKLYQSLASVKKECAELQRDESIKYLTKIQKLLKRAIL